MKHIKTYEGKNFYNIYYKLIKDLDIGDYVVIKTPDNYNVHSYDNLVGEIIDFSDTYAYIYFKDYHNTMWFRKEFIIMNSKLKKNIEDFIKAKKDSEKYNL